LLDEALLASANSGSPTSLLVIDIDHFKGFNDAHGHVAGDSALRYVASCIKSNIKGNDTAARYGGEEFAVILPKTSIEHAMSLAERIRHLVNARHLVKKATGVDMGRISVSVGVTESVDGDSADSLIHRADMCMYAAKNAGRNRVHDTPGPQAPQADPQAPQAEPQAPQAEPAKKTDAA
jgi:diguanylate cyclase